MPTDSLRGRPSRVESDSLTSVAAQHLDPTDRPALQRSLRDRGLIESDEKVAVAASAGEGNMNLALRVRMTASSGETQLRDTAAGPPVDAWLAEHAQDWLQLCRSAGGVHLRAASRRFCQESSGSGAPTSV